MKETEKNHFGNRMIICTIAVTLIWMTTLRMAVGLVDMFITAPSATHVWNTCSFSKDVVEDQSEFYEVCANKQVDTCNNDLSLAATQERQKVETNILFNEGLVSDARWVQSECESSVVMGQSALRGWQEVDIQLIDADGLTYTVPQSIIYRNSTVFTNEICSFVVEDPQTNSNSGASKTSVSKSIVQNTSRYGKQSNTRVGNLVDYSIELNAYNAAYIDNKTQTIQDLVSELLDDLNAGDMSLLQESLLQSQLLLNQLIDCVSLSDERSSTNAQGQIEYPECMYGTSFSSLYNQWKQNINVQLLVVQRNYNDLEEILQSLKDDAMDAMKNANDFYDSIHGATGVINWIGDNIPGANPCSGSGVLEFCSFSKYDWFIDVSESVYLEELFNLPDATVLWEEVELAVPVVHTALVDHTVELTDQGLLALQAAQVRLESIVLLEDYHPPAYAYADNITDEKKSQEDESDELVSITVGGVNELNQLDIEGTMWPNISGAYDFNRSYVSDPVSSFVPTSSVFDLPSQSLPFDSFLLLDWLGPLMSVQSLLYLFDYMYRILQTVRLIRTYWSTSAVKLPAVDTRLTKQKTGSGSSIANSILLFLTVLSYSWFVLLTVLCIAVLIAYSFAAIFIPFYEGYTAMCVVHAANDTFISQTMNIMAFNYASSKGNSILSKQMLIYDTDSQYMCSRQGLSRDDQGNNTIGESQSSYEDYANELIQLNESYRISSVEYNTLLACVDMEAMDSLFVEACEGGGTPLDNCPVDTLGNAFRPPGYYLNASVSQCFNGSINGEARMDVQLLRPIVYNCSVHPPCQSSCNGPDASVIETVARDCACTLEWFINANILQFCVGIGIFAIWHASRSWIVTGIAMMNWDKLSPQIFDVITSCDRNGVIIRKSQDDECAWEKHEGGVDCEDCTEVDEEACSGLSTGIGTCSEHFSSDAKGKLSSKGQKQIPLQQLKHASLGSDSGCHSIAPHSHAHDYSSADKKVRNKELQRLMRQYVWKGILYVLCGIAMNGVWVYILYKVHTNIVYEK